MSRSGVGLVVGVIGLLGGAFALQRALAPAVVDHPTNTTQTSSSLQARPPSSHAFVQPVALRTEVAPEHVDEAPPINGPSAPVWSVLRKGSPNAAQERESLIAALKSSTACVAQWCTSGRETLEGWSRAVQAELQTGVTADPVQCTAAGCWTRIVVTDLRKMREMGAVTQKITAQQAWQGPSIQGGADYETSPRSAISLWAILPDEPQDSGKVGEQ